MQPESLLPYSRQPAAGPCPQLDQSSPYLRILVLYVIFNTVLPSTPRFSYQNFVCICITFDSSHMPRPAHPIPLDLIILMTFGEV
jgi:hypothetical protein